MCPDTQYLLSVVDGSAAQDVVDHLRDCADCQRELAALKQQRAMLRALPEVPAPPPAPALLHTPTPRKAQRFAIAASVVIVGVLGMWLALTPNEIATDVVVDVAPTAKSPATVATLPGDELEMLARRSAQLERQWQFLNRHAPRVRRAAHEMTTAPLKSGLMQLDARYNELPEPKYWRQRVQLLDTLVTLEQTERLVRNDAAFGVRPISARTL